MIPSAKTECQSEEESVGTGEATQAGDTERRGARAVPPDGHGKNRNSNPLDKKVSTIQKRNWRISAVLVAQVLEKWLDEKELRHLKSGSRLATYASCRTGGSWGRLNGAIKL